jgi:hypothetical protein
MHHVINVSFVQVLGTERVKAVRNPHPGKRTPPEETPPPPVNPGDTVTWVITPANRELQVLFQQTLDLPNLDNPLPCNPLGPFNSLSIGAGLIVGTIRSADQIMNKRFLCNLYENGKELEWTDGIGGAPKLAGGLDIPMTPG